MIGLESFGPIVRGLILTSAAVLWTVLLVRIVGLRAFSKMTAFDFVATIATGSLIAQAGTRADWSEFFQAMAAIAGVFLIQWLLATARQHSKSLGAVMSNSPVLLMENGEFLDEALAESRVTRSSVIEKLRAANVSDIAKVHAVVLETTGDISVIHGGGFDQSLLTGVRRI
ncbi:MAG TPA: YetF domain-containing protein [Allosphingosinicella sp.]|nr:YetF domain-containing protein [Allosphingosinicella sp.]